MSVYLSPDFVAAKVVELKDGDQLRMGYRSYTVGSVIGSSLKNHEDPYEAIEQNRKNGGRDQFIFGNASVISSNHALNAARAKEFEESKEVLYDQLYRFEGIVSRIRLTRREFLHFERVSDKELHQMVLDFYKNQKG